MESPPAINLSSSQSSVPSSVQSFATSSSIPSSVPLSVPSSVSSSVPSSSAVADLRDSYVALVVAPGFEAVHAHLRNQRSIASFMAVFLDEFSSLALEHARRLQALAESGAARFERSFVQKAWLGIRAIGQSGGETLSEVGTTCAAWQSVRDGVHQQGAAHASLAAAVRDGPASALAAYLKETEEQAAKVEAWGLRLCEAMANYVKRAEDAKSVYHSKARGARMASKILEEAEKQAQIGGITRNIILSVSRMDKMKEAAEKSREEELESAKEYKAALDLVAKKRNELYSIRMPRVLTEIQLLVEQRTDRIKTELARFAAVLQTLAPQLLDTVSSMESAINGISPVIDTRVFVAQAMSNDSIPDVLEFVPFDAISAALIAGADKMANDESVVAAMLRDCSKTAVLAAQLAEKDPVAAAALRFLTDVSAFQTAENFEGAVEIYHKYLSDESVELVPVKPEVKRAIFDRVQVDNYSDRALFEEATKNVISHLEQLPIVREYLKPPVPLRKSFDAAPKSASPPQDVKSVILQEPARPPAPPKSPVVPVSNAIPQLVLRDSLDLGEEDFLGGSDDELLNRNDTLDDIVD